MDDAYIVTEIFIDKPYVRHVHVGDRPIVVDIGGYIGDFSVYAATYLNARKVFVYEPSPENFAILQQNIKNNNLEDRIEAVNSAVSDVEELFMDTDQERNDPAMVSPGYSAPGANYLRIVSVTLPKLIRTHGIEKIDLLKLDCEGAEYPILLSTPTELFEHIENIVFEYHEVGNFQSLLATVRCRLDDAGYQLKTEPPYVYAYR